MGVWSKFLFGLVDEHMVGLWVMRAVMDFFTRKQKYVPAFIVPIVSFDAIQPDIVVGEDQEIKPYQQSSLSDIRMIGGSVRVRCMDVQVTNVFVRSHPNDAQTHRNRNR